MINPTKVVLWFKKVLRAALSKKSFYRCVAWVAWPVWVVASLIMATILCQSLVSGWLPATTPYVLLLQAVVYVVFVFVLLAGPWIVGQNIPSAKQHLQVSLRQLGLQQSMSWRDIGLAVAGVIVYVILTAIFMTVAQQFISGFDATQQQEIGVSRHIFGVDRFLAFVSFVVVAPLAEEIAFRGYLYGKLRSVRMPWWLTTIVVSVLFGIAHGQWNVAVDVFALSLVMCTLRQISGTIWAGIIVHSIKNCIAFVGTFVLML